MIQAIKKLFGFGPKVNYVELVKQGAIIIDVRTKGEFEQGHIKKSVNIPVNILSANLTKFKDKNKPVITCCASGARSAMAKNILKLNGYSQVFNGGSWRSLEKKIRG